LRRVVWTNLAIQALDSTLLIEFVKGRTIWQIDADPASPDVKGGTPGPH
jgi:hypothetical protein